MKADDLMAVADAVSETPARQPDSAAAVGAVTGGPVQAPEFTLPPAPPLRPFVAGA
jgi:hypothetical protein